MDTVGRLRLPLSRRKKCVRCGGGLPTRARQHGDPYCSTRCCQLAHNVNAHKWRKDRGANTPKPTRRQGLVIVKVDGGYFYADTQAGLFSQT